MKDKSMTRFNIPVLATVAVLATILSPHAKAQDLFDESFLADDSAQAPQQEQTAAPAPEADATATQPDLLPAPADVPEPQTASASGPSMPDFGNDFGSAPASADLNLPPPPTNVPPPGSTPTASFGAGASKASLSGTPSDNIVGKMSSDIFREMAEMERENNNLALQLKKESLQAEIDALKASKRKTLFDEIERREKMTQARLEWELAQDLKRQEALERKQRAEIRQEQIKAALKAEEERRKKAEEDKARAEREKVQKEENEKKAKEAEERERVHAATLSANAKLVPVQISVARPDKLKRPAELKDRSSHIVMAAEGKEGERSSASLTAAAAAAAAASTAQAEEKAEVKKVPPAGTLYAISEIRGTAGTLIAKLLSKSDKSSFFVKKDTILPSGHIVINITKDYVLLRHGTNPEEIIGFSSGGLLSPGSDAPVAAQEEQTAPAEKKKTRTPRRKVSGKRFRSSAVSANR